MIGFDDRAKRSRESEGQCPSGRFGRQPNVPQYEAIPKKQSGSGAIPDGEPVPTERCEKRRHQKFGGVQTQSTEACVFPALSR